MIWTKGPSSTGAAYYSASCIVWRQDKAPLCKYIIRRVLHGKGFRWLLWQWDDSEGKFTPVPEAMSRLRHAQEKADWLERRNARAGVKPNHSSPIEAAAAEFAASFAQEEIA